jgi:hypothetical protein
MIRHPPRIPREVRKPQRKPDPRRAANHLAFIRQLECIACGARPPSQAAHVRSGTDGGTGKRPSDRFALPLCGSCHMKQHRTGELTFWGELNIDPIDISLKLWTVSANLNDGQRIVFRAQQTIRLRRNT